MGVHGLDKGGDPFMDFDCAVVAALSNSAS
jgi:hypothetical protein